MSRRPIATLRIDSDWATLQLVTKGATVQKLPSDQYPPNVIFTPSGLLFGQPNEQLKPQVVEIRIHILTNEPKVSFITGKGDNGVNGPRNGRITVALAGNEYTNTDIDGDGLNLKTFYDAPLHKY